MAPYVPTPALVTSQNPIGNQSASDITALASGGYVVTWADTPSFGGGSVRARVYDANGRPATGEILLGGGNQSSVTALPGGGFAIAWLQSGSSPGSALSVAARVFNAAGVAQTGPITLAAQPNGGFSAFALPEITALTDGRLLVAWRDGYSSSGSRVLGAILSPDGSVITPSFHLAPTLNALYGGYTDIALAPLPNGGFAVAYTGQTNSLTALSGTYNYGTSSVRIFDSAGSAVSSPVVLKDGLTTPVTAASLPDGRVAIGYQSGDNANAGQFVFRLVSSDGSLTAERPIGPVGTSGFSTSVYAFGNIDLSATADGNILVNYDRAAGITQGVVRTNSEISEIFSPDGQRLGLVSAGNPASLAFGNPNTINSQLAAALLNGSVALVESSSISNQNDVLTRVYQPAAVTSDPDGTPLVNDAFYNARNPDVAAAGIDPDQHYDLYGWREGRNPDALFNSDAYRFANPDVAAANVNPLAHYDQSGWKEGRDPSASFDNEVYLARNPDVKAAGLDPLLHYLQYGRAEGREASPAIGSIVSLINGSFDGEYYLLSNPDVGRAVQSSRTVAEAAQAAYQHYETYGWREGRNPNAYFDVTGYLNAYADVKAAGIDPLLHYDQSGWKEGRDPSGLFDTSNYLASNPDVRAAGVDPLLHFLQSGAVEGRAPLGDGTFE